MSKPKHQNRDREQRAWRNPLEVQRQREARDDEDKRKAEIEREKEKRKKHYQNKVKAPIQPKRAKPVKETTVIKKLLIPDPYQKRGLVNFSGGGLPDVLIVRAVVFLTGHVFCNQSKHEQK